MSCELSARYGQDPWYWLSAVPRAVVWAAIQMLPRLNAQEQIRLAHATQVGSPAWSQDAAAEHQKALAAWQRIADGESSVARKPSSPQGLRHMAAALGIGYTRVTKRKGA